LNPVPLGSTLLPVTLAVWLFCRRRSRYRGEHVLRGLKP
jgi:hypothetical protein